ncbi:MAG: polyprenyl synthetase family protein [Streptococcaceae bacterium]|jgi:geranylgeranyl diphosphate synthase type II|nr:polyprenyl synthetase family protein [Streptococcaceae bacterium]
MANFKQFTQAHLPTLERTLYEETKKRVDAKTLKDAMLYSLKAGGKRFRPMLFLAIIEIFQDEIKPSHIKLAAAIEMVHTYSLIHDDLPAMDNDDLRRGKPTNHIVFGEAMAILAGDGLLSLAFELTAENAKNTQLIKRFAQLAGVGKQGMVAGQVLDMEGESILLTLEELRNIHHKKTGGLIRYSVEGALLTLEIDVPELLLFADYIGIAFQIRDDILDVTKTSDELGKTAGKDEASNKSTYPAILGLDGAKIALENEVNQARQAIETVKKRFSDKDFSLLEDLLKNFS